MRTKRKREVNVREDDFLVARVVSPLWDLLEERSVKYGLETASPTWNKPESDGIGTQDPLG